MFYGNYFFIAYKYNNFERIDFPLKFKFSTNLGLSVWRGITRQLQELQRQYLETIRRSTVKM